MDDKFIIKGKDVERYFELNERLFDFSKLFPYETGDDRSVVIVGASFVDYVLEQILLAFFPNDEPEVDRLLSYDQPLGSYGNKVRIIYCLGLIDENVKNDLKLIGKIRNQFAHDLYASFEDDKIISWCKQLQWHKEKILGDPPPQATIRDIYQVGVHTVVGYLGGIVSQARADKRKLRKDSL